MTDEEFYMEAWKQTTNRCGCGTPLYLAMIIGVILLLSSCATKRIQYVDRVVEKEVVREVHDTLRESVHDSVFHTIIQKGDTVYDTKYIERTKFRDRIIEKKDTCWRDSIRTEYKENVVEKTIIPNWCYYSLAICILLFIFAIIKVTRWVQIH